MKYMTKEIDAINHSITSQNIYPIEPLRYDLHNTEVLIIGAWWLIAILFDSLAISEKFISI